MDISTIDPGRIRSAMRKAGTIRKPKSVRFKGLKRSVDTDDDYDELSKLTGFDDWRTRRSRSQQFRDALGLSFGSDMTRRSAGLDSINASFGDISAIGT